MPQSIAARDAQALIQGGGPLDIIDVREWPDWQRGHVPGARHVPLAKLTADPKGQIQKGKVLFVCAKGIRSLRAAEAAEGAGFSDAYSLAGGTDAWSSAGLPIEQPAEPPANSPEGQCSLPEPGLDEAVGKNLNELRTARGLTLDQLAATTGLSRAVLGQIERGKSHPRPTGRSAFPTIPHPTPRPSFSSSARAIPRRSGTGATSPSRASASSHPTRRPLAAPAGTIWRPGPGR